MGKWTIRASMAIALGLTPFLMAAGGEPTPRARYLLAPGREFSYHSETQSKREDGRIYVVDWRVWSICQDPDGTWRTVIRCDLRTKEKKSPKQFDQDRVDTLVWRCRMFDDGRMVDATMMGNVRDPFRLFPRLPSGPEARRERMGIDRTG